MFQALLKLILITGLTLLLGFFAVFVIRQMGLQQNFSATNHPWEQQRFWWVYAPSAEELCQTKDLPSAPWILLLPLQRQEQNWVIPCAQPQLVQDFLAHQSHTDWLLHIRTHDTWGLDELVDKVSTFDQNKRFGVLSESQKAAVYLRKKAPQWLYAADGASLLRFRLFESLWIESAMEFWPDFIVTSAKDSFRLDERGVAELQRRKKRVLWDWDESADKEPPFAIQGIMTKRPSAAQQKFGAKL